MKNINYTFLLLFIVALCNYSHGQGGLDWNTSGNTGTTAGTHFVGTTDAKDLSFKTNSAVDNTPKMELQSNGELGIGTTSPISWLHVIANSTQETFRTDVNSDINNYWRMLRNGTEYGRIYHLSGTGGNGTAFYVHGVRGDLRIGGGSSGSVVPALQMEGGSGSTSGYVGVGDYTTFDPASLFHIHRNTAATKSDFQMTNATTGSSSTRGLLVEVAATTPTVNFKQQEDQDIVFFTGSSGGTVSERMRIRSGTNNGRIGMGTGSPSAKVHIVGDATAPSFLITNSAAFNTITALDNSVTQFRSTSSSGSTGSFDFNSTPPTSHTTDLLGIFCKTVGHDSMSNTNNVAIKGYADDLVNTGGGATTITGVSGEATSSNPNPANIYGMKGKAVAGHANQTIHGGYYTAESASGPIHGSVYYGLSGQAINGTVDNYGLWGKGNGGADSWGVFGEAVSASANIYGVEGFGHGAADFVFGLRGSGAGDNTNTVRGVYGVAVDGAVIYGIHGEAIPVNPPCTTANCASAAGYFDGDVAATGFGTFNLSDIKFKNNIAPLNNGRSLLAQLSPVSYEYKISQFPSINLTPGTHHGLIAQDVQAVMPSLVKQFLEPAVYDSSHNLITPAVDFLTVNYDMLTPFILDAVNEAHERIDSLINAINNLPKPTNNINLQERNALQIELKDISTIILNQNDPNPFNESTRITFSIPEGINSAKMLFTNSAGTIINTLNIEERGVSELQVFASDLSSGIYTYTLICDGQVIDSKKMLKQ